ncbi:MAG: hypothetical protein J3K34DRAFT_446646 [Monoraphidium minutum]|nr:MAG: hypothetical protein J3K34DRAFT_446646 [Monoraphidium minutum]
MFAGAPRRRLKARRRHPRLGARPPRVQAHGRRAPRPRAGSPRRAPAASGAQGGRACANARPSFLLQAVCTACSADAFRTCTERLCAVLLCANRSKLARGAGRAARRAGPHSAPRLPACPALAALAATPLFAATPSPFPPGESGAHVCSPCAAAPLPGGLPSHTMPCPCVP